MSRTHFARGSPPPFVIPTEPFGRRGISSACACALHEGFSVGDGKADSFATLRCGRNDSVGAWVLGWFDAWGVVAFARRRIIAFHRPLLQSGEVMPHSVSAA